MATALRRRVPRRAAQRLLCVAVLLAVSGCAVPQPRGKGTMSFVHEPGTQRGYFLYLPKTLKEAAPAARGDRLWPLVMTFHGMKPYDTSLFQILEWQQEADRYGFIVVAPELLAFDFIIGEFPQQTINPLFKSDEKSVLAIMDHVAETFPVDTERVLSTGFSSGGYMAHYMLNRHPERFACLAVRQANFSAAVLDSSATAASVRHPVMIMNTELDVPVCVTESRDAIKWYESHGYKRLAWVKLPDLAHERTPDVAAEFFVRAARIRTVDPESKPICREALDGNPAGLALIAGDLPASFRIPALDRRPPAAPAASPTARRPARPTPPRAVTPAAAASTPPNGGVSAAAADPAAKTTPPRGPRPPAVAAVAPVSMELSTAVGYAPLRVAHAALAPADWSGRVTYEWTLNGQRVALEPGGQMTIPEPGDYTLELLVVTEDGREYRAARQIRVLQRVSAAAP
jgi:dienelactone hydrolase